VHCIAEKSVGIVGDGLEPTVATCARRVRFSLTLRTFAGVAIRLFSADFVAKVVDGFREQ